ncbi:MAG: DUF1207 domain-containing protein [Phycisphaerae bacterium]|jgi:hypothetical protein|nr:DUF1207 domain-containing protein [Phycisphaerae bacterium]
MRNRERKLVTLIFVAVLLSVSTGAVGRDVDTNVRTDSVSAAGGDVRIARSGAYEVRDVVLRLNRQKCNVGVKRMSFVPRGGIVSEECTTAIDAETHTAVTTLKLRAGRTIKLRTELAGDRPIVRLHLPAVAGELVLELTGTDRLTFATTNGFSTHTLAGDDRTVLLPAAGAFQNRRSQDGIVLHAASNASVRMHMIYREGRATVHIASREDAVSSVILTGFCGDASIACEDMAPGVRFAIVQEAVPTSPAALVRSIEGGAAAAVSGAPKKFTDTGWSLFTNGDRALAPLLADQREAQIRGGWMYGRDGDKFLDLGFGGDLGILRRDFSPDEAMTLTLRGLFTARFQTDAESFPLLNTDYYGGFAFGHRFGRNAWEVFVYHQSAHLGDETLDFGTRARIDYGRESVRFLWSHNILDNLRVYGGPTVNVSGSEDFVRGKVMLQAGGEYRFRPWDVPMYAAGDVQVREQNEWRPSFNAQLGMYLGKDKAKNPKPKTRVFLELFTGYSNMGQYWDTYETSGMIGLGYNW